MVTFAVNSMRDVRINSSGNDSMITTPVRAWWFVSGERGLELFFQTNTVAQINTTIQSSVLNAVHEIFPTA